MYRVTGDTDVTLSPKKEGNMAMKNEIGVRISYRNDTDLTARFKQAQEMELFP